VWDEHASEALDLKPVLKVEAGGDKLLLLRRGGAIGMAAGVSERPASVILVCWRRLSLI
jgi:hypothetical protein